MNDVIEKLEISTDKKFKWYALMCIPNHENSVKKKIDNELKIKNLTNWVDVVYVPTIKTYSVRNGKRFAREKVMIPGYILIHMDLANGELIPLIKRISGVSSWLNPSDGKKSDRPEEMRQKDVERFLNVREEKVKNAVEFSVGEEVKVNKGTFSGFLGNINWIKGDKVNILIKIFGKETPTDLNIIDIEKI